MNIDQVQRRDIDELGVNTISLAIDELSDVDESFIDLLTSNLSANNWYSDDGALSKDMLANNDKLVFSLEPQADWKYKDIVEIRLVGNIYSSSEISLESIGINSTFTSTDLSINGSTNVDVAFDISEISQEDLNSLITDKGFDIVINFDSLKTNASVSIIELQVVFVFNDKLQGEKEAILNRINDSGWITPTILSPFKNYDFLQYRKYGKVVEIRGAVEPTQTIPASTTEQHTVFNLPEDYRPSYTITKLQQGSGANIFLQRILPTGDIIIERYRVGDTYNNMSSGNPHGSWLNLCCTYLVD